MLWQCIKREIKGIIIIDPRRVIFLFGAVLIYFFLFSLLYENGVVKAVPTVICDQDQSAVSRQLVKRFSDHESFSIIQFVSTEEEMQEAIKQKKAYAAIQIPKDFAKKISRGESTTVLYMVNGANIIFANTTSSAGQDIIFHFSDQIAAKRGAMKLGINENQMQEKIAPIHHQLRVLGNPTQSYVLFFTIGLSMTAFQQGLFFAIGASIHHDYQHLTEIQKMPPGTLLAAKMITYWGMAVVAFALFHGIAVFYWGIPIKAPWWNFCLLISAFIFCVISFGALVSTLFFTELRFIRTSLIYVVPAFILSGYTWPIESMPIGMQVLAAFFPLSWFSNALRDLWLLGVTAHVHENMIALISMGIGCLALLKKSYVNGLLKHSKEPTIFR